MSASPALWKRALVGLHAALALPYLLWRAAYTLNTEHPVYAAVFFVAEVFCVLSSLVFYQLVSGRAEAPVPPPVPGARRPPSIDVFICTYDEDVDLLRTTAVAARDMDGPHATWICDDGRRPAVEALAREIGVGYRTRPSNEHYKAGNLNAALVGTHGELLLVLDADHVPRRQMAARLAAQFADAEVALVQTPQVYYNIDSYQHHVSTRARRLWHEATVFHHMMQPGAARHNAAFFVGTGAMLRRAAIEKVGGFATDSITEDIDTSMRLHDAGYRSVYVDEALGYLLAPDTPLAYAGQRLRWAQGAMQILRREGLRLRPNLTAWQRVTYLNSLAGYLAAWQHLLFYVAPGLFIATGITPIAVDPTIGFPIFVARIVFDLVVYLLLGAPHARLFLGECYKMLTVAIFLRASATLLFPKGLRFLVTPKGLHTGLPLEIVLPAAALFVFNLTAVGFGLFRLVQGDPHPGALVLTTFFAAQFSIASALALAHAWERRGAHERFAFPVAFPAADGLVVRRLNHDLAYAVATREVTVGEATSLDLGLGHPVPARVVASERTGGGSSVVKLELAPLAPADRDTLDHYFFNVALPGFLQGLRDAPTGPPPDPVLTDATPTNELLVVRSGIL